MLVHNFNFLFFNSNIWAFLGWPGVTVLDLSPYGKRVLIVVRACKKNSAWNITSRAEHVQNNSPYQKPQLLNFTFALILQCWLAKCGIYHIFSSAMWTESRKYYALQSQKNQYLWISQCYRKNFNRISIYCSSEDGETVWLYCKGTASSMLTICQPGFWRSHITIVSSRILVAFIHYCKYELFLCLPAEKSCTVLINNFLTSNTVILNSRLINTFAFCLYALPGLN